MERERDHTERITELHFNGICMKAKEILTLSKLISEWLHTVSTE